METRLKKMEERKKQLKVRSYVVRQKILRDICAIADVVRAPIASGRKSPFTHRLQICTTCIKSASYTLNVIDFPVVFLDEASMSTEPASLVALMKGVSTLRLV